VIIASEQYALVAQYIYDKAYPLENPALLNLIGFIAIALMIWIIAAIAGIVFAHFANKNSKMGLISRLAGLGLSGGKYFLVFSVLFISLLKITLIRDNVAPKLDLNSSIAYPYMQQNGNELLLLEEMRVFDSTNFQKKIENQETNETTTTTQTNETNLQINTLIVNEP
jgi:uncharacterized membrane protein required for colicin V production